MCRSKWSYIFLPSLLWRGLPFPFTYSNSPSILLLYFDRPSRPETRASCQQTSLYKVMEMYRR